MYFLSHQCMCSPVPEISLVGFGGHPEAVVHCLMNVILLPKYEAEVAQLV